MSSEGTQTSLASLPQEKCHSNPEPAVWGDPCLPSGTRVTVALCLGLRLLLSLLPAGGRVDNLLSTHGCAQPVAPSGLQLLRLTSRVGDAQAQTRSGVWPPKTPKEATTSLEPGLCSDLAPVLFQDPLSESDRSSIPQVKEKEILGLATQSPEGHKQNLLSRGQGPGHS